MSHYLEITATQGNIDHGGLRIPNNEEIFPKDSWGGSNRKSSGTNFTVVFAGTLEEVSTDIDGEKQILRRARGHFDRFFKHHSITKGRSIFIVKRGIRKYEVTTKKPNSVASETNTSSEENDEKTGRQDVVVSRVIRDTKISKKIKKRYRDCCQICGYAVPTASGTYSEGAHIKPLGEPHNGPDKEGNILCLCPNHHVMLDNGAITLNDDLSISGVAGSLTLDSEHVLDIKCIRYHRNINNA